jgi:hypothetical protein
MGGRSARPHGYTPVRSEPEANDGSEGAGGVVLPAFDDLEAGTLEHGQRAVVEVR